MADRQNIFLLKRSNVPGKVPLPGDIKLGELALNTSDAILYTSGTTQNQILPIGWDRINRTGDTVNGNFNFFGDVEISGSTLPSGYTLSVTGDTNFIGDVYVVGDLTYDGNLNISGATIIYSGLSADTLTLTDIPLENNNLIQILGRNSSTGVVEFRDVKTIGNNVTIITGSTYTAITTDNIIGVDTSLNTVIIDLPDSVISGRLRYEIKDIGVNSYNNPITINASGSDTIITTSVVNSFQLSSDGGAIILLNTGLGQWWQM